MFHKGAGGADKLFVPIMASLVIVEEWEAAVSEVKPHIHSILSFSPVGLARSPGQERGL